MLTIKKKEILLATTIMTYLLILTVLAAWLPQPAAAAATTAAPCAVRHTGKAGETLSSIAFEYGVTYLEIAEANDLQAPYVLQIGQILCIPGGTRPGDTPKATSSTTDSTGINSITKNPNLKIYSGFSSVWVKVIRMRASQVYNVRINNACINSNYTTIGDLRTNSSGNYEGYFPLPKWYTYPRVVTVCLKDVTNDKTTCESAYNQYWSWLPIRGCAR